MHTSTSVPHLNIAVAGATGAVGVEMLQILEQRQFPLASLRVLASARSAGATLHFRGQPLTVRELSIESLAGVDLALFSAGSSITRSICPKLRAAGWDGCVIDNSSAFRMNPEVPLVIPEVNPEAVRHPADANARGWPRIIANPNCSTIILLVALSPLRRAFGVAEAIVSTYQAASGAGAKGLAELESQSRDDLAGRPVRPGVESGGVFHEPYAFNLFSHNADIDPATGLNSEEVKMIHETRRIWNDKRVSISPTCIRVPVRRAHAESVHLTLERPATLAQVRGALGSAPGLRLVDDRASNDFPTPLKASGIDDVLVGRVRVSPAAGLVDVNAAATRFELFICGDQLRKGAALNAVQIAELLVNQPAEAKQ